MRDLHCRIHALKTACLEAMTSLPKRSTLVEFYAVKARWKHFKTQATEEATEPGEAREVIASFNDEPAFKHYRTEAKRHWRESPRGKAWFRDYQRNYMRERRAKGTR